MDSHSPYKKFGNEGTNVGEDLTMKPPVYSYDQGPVQSTHVVVTQPTTTVCTGQSVPPSYLWLSMVACCFCWPMAICALVLSHDSAYAAGAMDYDTARTKGRKAMRISIGAIVVGLIMLAISITSYVVKIYHFETETHTKPHGIY